MCEEPRELGLGYARGTKSGSFIGAVTAQRVAELFSQTPQLHNSDLRHIEELGLLVPLIAEDRISDLTACVLRNFLVSFSATQARDWSIPTLRFRMPHMWDADRLRWRPGGFAKLPYHPDDESPLLLAPLDLLRHLPWINYADFYKSFFARHVLPSKPRKTALPKPQVLAHNRSNFENVERYVDSKEKTAHLATPDPLFEPLKQATIARKVREIQKLPSGRGEPAKRYEDLAFDVLQSALFPELEFADSQVRTDSGAHIRDIIFYNDAKEPFTRSLREEYGCHQLVFELKNVKDLEPEHVNQLYRYLGGDFGQLGVLVTRKEPPRAVRRNITDLWSSKRVGIVCLTDDDLSLIVEVHKANRRPIAVVKKKYAEFVRTLPR